MFQSVLVLLCGTVLISGEHRRVAVDTKGGRICNGIVHVQGICLHFFPEKPGGDVGKALFILSKGKNSKGQTAEKEKQKSSKKQLPQRKGNSFFQRRTPEKIVIAKIYGGRVSAMSCIDFRREKKYTEYRLNTRFLWAAQKWGQG